MASRVVTVDSTEVHLTPIEYKILLMLVKNAGKVVTHKQLLAQVWGYEYYGDLRVVDAAIKRLRAKLRRVAQEDVVTTVRGVGYRLPG